MDSNVIEKYYIKYKYPNLDRLYNIMKEDEVNVTKKQIKEFLDTKAEKQITQQRKVFKGENGHITAFDKNELWQIDQFFLPKYYKKNRGYKYIFCVIDVFTRYVYCIPLKNKDNEDVIYALEKLLKQNRPQKIMSDSDSVFTSRDFQKLMDDYDIIHETVPVGDHESLGIIDRFARTLKQRLTDIFLATDDTNWIDNIDDVIDDYNKTKNKGILDIKPNKANSSENKPLLVEYNRLKSLKNRTIGDLKIGDKVRVYTKKMMEKGTEPQYSNEVYTVETIRGKTIILNNQEKKRRNDLLLVPQNSENSNKKNIIKEATKKYQDELFLKRDGIDENNIIMGRRNR